jgi:Integrase zinc binding domain/Integrase core domain
MIDELQRSEDPVLFPRLRDPFHPKHAALLAEYVRLYQQARQLYQSQFDCTSFDEPQAHHSGASLADELFTSGHTKAQRRTIRKLARELRVHPMHPAWYVRRAQLRTGDRLWLAVPPVEYRWDLIGAYHDRLGHSGVSQTLATLHQHFDWPGMKADISAFVEVCHSCQLKHLSAEDVASVATPRMSEPFEHVHVDLAGPFLRAAPQQSQRKSALKAAEPATQPAYVVVMVDYFTKAAEFAVIPDKSAASVAKAFHNLWILCYGAPALLTNDNGLEFAGAFRHLLERLGIDHIHTSVRHPQSNGAVERVVRSLKELLAATAVGGGLYWENHIPQIRMEYMQRIHSTLGCSPNEMVYATRPHFPPPIGAAHWPTTNVSSVLARCIVASAQAVQYQQRRDERYLALTNDVRERLHKAQQTNRAIQARRLATKRRNKRQLRQGDLAYLLEASNVGFKAKVKGPFVVEAIKDQQVDLRSTAQVAERASVHFTVHISRVARATTITDVLQDLLKQAGLQDPGKPPPAAV